MIRRAITLAFLAVTLTGCVSSDSSVVRKNNGYAEAAGSPYRWKYKANLFGGGGEFSEYIIDLAKDQTKADASQKLEITRAIDEYEVVMGRPPRSILDVRPLPDGREVWTLDLEDGYFSTYVVTLHRTQYSKGDFDIGMPKIVPKNE